MNKFFTFQGSKIPVRRDESTELYVESDTSDTPRLLTILLGNGGWCVEGAVFSTNQLGIITYYQVTLVEHEIEIHNQRGKFGQLRRRALVAPMPLTYQQANDVRQLNLKGSPQ